MSGGAGDVDTGEEGVAPPDPEASWEVGAGMVPDDAAEGEAALQDSGNADASPS